LQSLVGPDNYFAGATHMSRKSEAVQETGIFGTICPSDSPFFTYLEFSWEM